MVAFQFLQAALVVELQLVLLGLLAAQTLFGLLLAHMEVGAVEAVATLPALVALVATVAFLGVQGAEVAVAQAEVASEVMVPLAL